MKLSRLQMYCGFSAIGCLLLVVYLVGCSNVTPKNDLATAYANQQANSSPESVLSELSANKAAEINSFSTNVSLTKSIPVQDQEFSATYIEWYRKGYAFAFITGNAWLRDQVARDGLERVKYDGWYDGNSAGGLASYLKKIYELNTNHSK